MLDPEAGWDILIGSLLKHFARENRSKRSEKPDFLNLNKLEALKTKHLKTSGSVLYGLREEMKWAREQEEFENYVTLLNEARAHFGCNLYYIITLYISKHKGEFYCMSCECECN